MRPDLAWSVGARMAGDVRRRRYAVDLLQTLPPLLLAVSLAALVAVVGMQTTLDEALYLVRHPVLLVKAVVAVNVVVPLAAALLVSIFPIPVVAKAGILLMAVSPVPPLAPGKEIKVGGRKLYAYSLYITLVLLSVIFVPLTVALLSWWFGRDVSLSTAALARSVGLTVVTPFVLGLLVRRFSPALAEKLTGVLGPLATILVLVVFVPMVVLMWPTMLSLIGNGTILAMALVCLVALTAGHLLGGADQGDRAALAVTAATRHPGIALMIAGANNTDPRVPAAIIGFMIVGLLVSAPYQHWVKSRVAPSPAAP